MRLIMYPKIAIVTVLVLAAVWLSATLATAQNKGLTSVGTRVPQNQLVSIDRIDHSAFHGLLQKYVDGDGMVNYSQWLQSTADRAALQQYLSLLSHANPDAPAAAANKLAFWINAYNAVTLEGILAVYPTTSIRKHTAKLVGYNIWKDLKLIVGNRSISLEGIEHQVLRKMGEPRIHFAIVCASIGCPRLLNEAYGGANLEQQLAGNSRDFFSRDQNLRYDSARRTLQLGAILQWFGSDFGADQNAQLASIAGYFPESIRRELSRGGLQISYQSYNWNLNDQKTQTARSR